MVFYLSKTNYYNMRHSELPAENAAPSVDVVDGEFRAVDHGEPVDVDGTGPVEETADRNLTTLGADAAGDERRSHRGPERLQRLPPVHLHGSPPESHTVG